MLSGDEFYDDNVTSGQTLGDPPYASGPPEDDEPDLDTLSDWMADGGCEALDGCWVEPDGTCEHGQRSWLLQMGLI